MAPSVCRADWASQKGGFAIQDVNLLNWALINIDIILVSITIIIVEAEPHKHQRTLRGPNQTHICPS